MGSSTIKNDITYLSINEAVIGLGEVKCLELISDYLRKESNIKLRRKLLRQDYIHEGSDVKLVFPTVDPRSTSTVDSPLVFSWLYEGVEGKVTAMGESKELVYVSFTDHPTIPVSLCYLCKLN